MQQVVAHEQHMSKFHHMEYIMRPIVFTVVWSMPTIDNANENNGSVKCVAQTHKSTPVQNPRACIRCDGMPGSEIPRVRDLGYVRLGPMVTLKITN